MGSRLKLELRMLYGEDLYLCSRVVDTQIPEREAMQTGTGQVIEMRDLQWNPRR